MSETNYDELNETLTKLQNTIADSTELAHEIKALQDALEASEKIRSESLHASAALQVEEMSELAKKYLNEKTQADMGRKAMSLSVVFDDGRAFKAVYFAVRTRTENVEKGAQVIAPILNELSAAGLIHSCLAPLSSFKLARLPLQSDQSVVFSFVLVPFESEAEIREKYKGVYIMEGGVGELIDDLKPILKDGEFLAAISVGVFFNPEANPGELLKNEIDRYLAILPKGTEVREVVDCAIISLAVPFEVRFFNPLLKQVKRVELETVRHAERVGDRVEEFNLALGMKYFDANDEGMFR